MKDNTFLKLHCITRRVGGGGVLSKGIAIILLSVSLGFSGTVSAKPLPPHLLSHLLEVLEGVLPFEEGVFQLDRPVPAQYGSGFGSDEHSLNFDGTFTDEGEDVVLSVRGFDIDHSNEVAVYLNGVLLGYILPTFNSTEGQITYFRISAAQLAGGTNTVSFQVANGSDGTWGITDILVERADVANRNTQLGLPIVTNAEWNNTAVRKVLHALCYGGKASDTQIQTWADMSPDAAIQQMLTFDTENLLVSPDASDYKVPSNKKTMRDFIAWMSSNASKTPVPKSDRDEFDYQYRFFDIWPRMSVAWGLNPCRQRIGFWETNYHLATNLEASVNYQQMARYYDDIMDALASGLPYEQVLAVAAKSAAVAAQYKHYNNEFNQNNGVFSGNDDFAREIHQLFFGILGNLDPEGGLDHHENVTIPQTARALTDMRIHYDSSIGRRPDFVTFGTEEHYYNNQPLDILNTDIYGNDASERIDNLVQVSVAHPESLANLPIMIVTGLMDDELDESKFATIRAAWAAMPQKNLLEFLRTYAISTLFHNSSRVRYATSFDRHVTQVNKLALNNSEALRNSSDYRPDNYESEGVTVFEPEYNVFGGQRPQEAVDNAAIFQHGYEESTDDSYRFERTDCSSCDNNGSWEKDWAAIIPTNSNGDYNVEDVAKWLWNHFLGDGLKNYGPLERAHLIPYLAARQSRDLSVLLAVRQGRLDSAQSVTLNDLETEPGPDVDLDNYLNLITYPYTVQEVTETAHIVDLVNELAARNMNLDSSDDGDREDANRKVGRAINFLLSLPYNYMQEGQ